MSLQVKVKVVLTNLCFQLSNESAQKYVEKTFKDSRNREFSYKPINFSECESNEKIRKFSQFILIVAYYSQCLLKMNKINYFLIVISGLFVTFVQIECSLSGKLEQLSNFKNSVFTISLSITKMQ